MSRAALSHKSCPVCQWDRLIYAFATSGGAFYKCAGCGIFLCDPTRSHTEQKAIDFWSKEQRANSSALDEAEKKHYLDMLQRHVPKGKLLEIGCGKGDFLLEARSRGFEVAGLEGNRALADMAAAIIGRDAINCAENIEGVYEKGSFDVVVLFDLMGIFSNPIAIMRYVHEILRPNGLFVFCVPLADSRAAALLRQEWVEFNKRQSVLFDANSVQNALFLAGFDRSLLVRHPRQVSLDWLRKYLEQFQLRWGGRLAARMITIFPRGLRQISFQVAGGHGVVMSHAKPLKSEHVLSIIIPVFNERSSFAELIETVLAKEIPGLKKEIIIVESNSTDGSREEVLRFQDRPEVQVILQDKPRGKGHAVRAGLAEATGDYVLIQDADLEYDINDYDALLEPLITGREAFVLGSRHGGSNIWKMRKFNEQHGLAFFVNFGHWIFLTLLNALFLQRLRDPFTMFKVFRRDCLHGLEFKCDRFDFDFEILIKLIRKGYRPIELPVNYRARSFKEGKKVRLFRDPITWLRALIWLRFVKIDPAEVVERTRHVEPMKTAKDPAKPFINK
ncbi:MAG: glycosyltransferase [Verrucomicrobiota bacterium]